MAIKLFISPQVIQQTTILGGNVDIDKFQFCIESVQNTVIEPLLGSELYDKVVLDYKNDTLAGLYLTLFNDFVQPITKFESTAEYIKIAPYKVANGGVFKHSPENAVVVEKDEVESLAQMYRSNAQTYVLRFNKWIGLNNITEYKTSQNEVNASKDISLTAGWFL